MQARAFTHYAVLDLGSNSFHMLIARDRGELQIIDKLREPVRLAMGLNELGEVDEAAQLRAMDCLERFAQRIRELPEPHVRVVATNTFRRAKNGKKLRKRVAQVLGHSVEVLSGEEEARLIYLGVNQGRSDPGRRKLVVDIGGGSTEFIVGRDAEIETLHSLFMGCVGYTRRFFADGAIAEENFAAAEIAALLEVRAIRRSYTRDPVELVLGVSGSCNAISEILRANEWTDGRIDGEGLTQLRKALLRAGHVDSLSLPGLRDDRGPVIAAGCAVLSSVFEGLGLEEMQPVQGALREGVLLDLIGREHQRDIRHQTVEQLLKRFQIDRAQATRVADTGKALLQQMDFSAAADGFRPENFLRWSAQLHELGLLLAYTGYHRHGAYFLENAALPGFSDDDKHLMALLVRNHRRRLLPDSITELSGPHEQHALLLTVLLRLAVLLNRSRSGAPAPAISGDLRRGSLQLVFEGDWLRDHPLTQADLQEERNYLREVDVELKYRDA